MTRNGWQLAVIDIDRCNERMFPLFCRTMRNDVSLNAYGNAVVFIIDTMWIPIDNVTNNTDVSLELKKNRMFSECGMSFAYVCIPSEKTYFCCPIMALAPILSEEDAIDVETRLGVDVRRWM